MIKLLVLVMSLWAGAAQAQMTAEPLMPEQAFRFSADMIDAQTIAVRWDIAPGYYMYKYKFSFVVEPAPAALGKFSLPAGIVKEDPTFGRVETYRDVVNLQLPLSGARGKILLKATSQGCADLGVCYPPQKHSVTLNVPAGSATASGKPATPGDSPASLLLSNFLWPVLLGMAGLALVTLGRTRAWKWVGGEFILIAIALAVFMRFFASS